MTNFQSLLALNIKGYIPYFPLGVAILCGVVLLIAFIVGFSKGAKKVKYGGVAWLVAGVGYVFADKFLHAKNPVNNILKGRFSTVIVDFASSFSIALACILATLLLGAICRLFLREKKKKNKKRKENLDNIGVSYDENFQYQVFDKKAKKKKRKEGKPSFFSRLIGGFACAINSATILLTIIVFTLFVIYSTKLKNGVLAPVLTVSYVRFLLKYALLYAVDLAIIGVIIGFASLGKKVGFFNILRPIIVKVGGLVAVVACFYIPFSRFLGKVTLMNSLVTRAVNALAKIGASAKIATIGGKIIAGLLLAIVVIIAILLLNFVMKKIGKGIKKVGIFHVLDSALSCVVFLVIGVVVVAVALAITYALAQYNLFHAGGLLTGDTVLSSGIYDVFDVYLKGYLQRFSGLLGGLMGKIPV